jgi:hypothetical protein
MEALLGSREEVLTPKIGTGKGLICGPSLVTKCHSAGNLLRGFGKNACGRQYTIIRQRECFALERGNVREYVMTWPEYREGTN